MLFLFLIGSPDFADVLQSFLNAVGYLYGCGLRDLRIAGRALPASEQQEECHRYAPKAGKRQLPVIGEKGDGDDERFVWRFKGTFNIPDETSATENNGTDANNLSLVYTGIYTNHAFANGKGVGVKGSAKAMFIRASANVCTSDQFFSSVATPDTTFADNTLTINAGFNTAITVTRNGVALTDGAAIANGEVLTISAKASAGYPRRTRH